MADRAIDFREGRDPFPVLGILEDVGAVMSQEREARFRFPKHREGFFRVFVMHRSQIHRLNAGKASLVRGTERDPKAAEFVFQKEQEAALLAHDGQEGFRPDAEGMGELDPVARDEKQDDEIEEKRDHGDEKNHLPGFHGIKNSGKSFPLQTGQGRTLTVFPCAPIMGAHARKDFSDAEPQAHLRHPLRF